MGNVTYKATLLVERNHEEENEEGWFPFDLLGVTVHPERPTHNMVDWVEDMVANVGLKDILDEETVKELEAKPFEGAEILAIEGTLWSHEASSYYGDDYEDGFDADTVRLPHGEIFTCPECMISYEDPTPVCTGCTWTIPVPREDLDKVQGPVRLDYPHNFYFESRDEMVPFSRVKQGLVPSPCTGEAEAVDFEDPAANLYGCKPCPRCSSKFRAPYKREGGGIMIECDDCGYKAPVREEQTDEQGS